MRRLGRTERGCAKFIRADARGILRPGVEAPSPSVHYDPCGMCRNTCGPARWRYVLSRRLVDTSNRFRLQRPLIILLRMSPAQRNLPVAKDSFGNFYCEDFLATVNGRSWWTVVSQRCWCPASSVQPCWLVTVRITATNPSVAYLKPRVLYACPLNTKE